MTNKIENSRGFRFFEELDSDSLVLDKLIEKLWKRLVPSEGECESMQGEMIRTLVRISHELYSNANMNWINEKFELNEAGYPEGYLPDWDERDEDDFVPSDITECKTTIEELNNTVFDEMLNQTKEWLAEHPLPEWDTKRQAKIQAALERARKIVPVGVISEHHWYEYCKKNQTQEIGGWEVCDEHEQFARAQIAYWIYRNPDLVDKNNNPLNQSVADVFSKVKGLTKS